MVQIRVPVSDTEVKKPRGRAPMSRKKVEVKKLNKPNKLEELHAKEFTVDERVQRAQNEIRVQQMAEDFRPDSMGLITASRRDNGHIYILDGQHRVAAARLAKYDGLIATRVFENLTIAEEAGLFLTLNQTRKVESIDKFKVRVTMGERSATAINNVLKRYNLQVDFGGETEKKKVLSAIVTLEKIYHGAGVWKRGEYSELVDRTIKTIHTAYGPQAERVAYSRPIIEGIGILHAHFGKRIDEDRLIKSLQSIVPRQLNARARTLRDAKGGTIGSAAAEVIHSLYNRNLRGGGNKLPEFADVNPLNQDIKKDPLEVDPNDFVAPQVENQTTIEEQLQHA